MRAALLAAIGLTLALAFPALVGGAWKLNAQGNHSIVAEVAD